MLQAQVSQQPFLKTFSMILQDELDRRRSRLLERRYQQSGLDERRTLAEFDWVFNPKVPRTHNTLPNMAQKYHLPMWNEHCELLGGQFPAIGLQVLHACVIVWQLWKMTRLAIRWLYLMTLT